MIHKYLSAVIQSEQYIKSALSANYPQTEIRSFWLLILEHLTGLSRTDILLNKNKELSEIQKEEFKTIVARLEKMEPIQYILGETEFYSLPFKVDNRVLIPRSETEELVDWILKDNAQSNGNILDIGTGSGCIAVSLAKNLAHATVFAIDVSNDAIDLASENARLNEVRIDFLHRDALADNLADTIPEHFDIIVSNPPYVCNSEKEAMSENVLDNEPHLALFVHDNDPLIFYRQIAYFAKEKLNPGGRIYFEINQAFGPETVHLLEENGFSNVELRKDIYGRDRMVKGTLIH